MYKSKNLIILYLFISTSRTLWIMLKENNQTWLYINSVHLFEIKIEWLRFTMSSILAKRWCGKAYLSRCHNLSRFSTWTLWYRVPQDLMGYRVTELHFLLRKQTNKQRYKVWSCLLVYKEKERGNFSSKPSEGQQNLRFALATTVPFHPLPVTLESSLLLPINTEERKGIFLLPINRILSLLITKSNFKDFLSK